MAGTDIRGFSYPLDPIRSLREWKLDMALAELGDLNRRLADKRAAGAALMEQCAAQALQATRSWTARSDPVAKTRALQYLATLHARAVRTQREIAALSHELRLARQQCVSEKDALELIEADRTKSLEAYARDKASKFSADVDADWIARASQPFQVEDST
jgi:hypothetical protein